MTDNGFTPTQQAILKVLSDGEPHSKEDLRLALGDEMASMKTVRVHLSHIRKKLPEKEFILCVVRGYNISYQHVRRLY